MVATAKSNHRRKNAQEATNCGRGVRAAAEAEAAAGSQLTVIIAVAAVATVH